MFKFKFMKKKYLIKYCLTTTCNMQPARQTNNYLIIHSLLSTCTHYHTPTNRINLLPLNTIGFLRTLAKPHACSLSFLQIWRQGRRGGRGETRKEKEKKKTKKKKGSQAPDSLYQIMKTTHQYHRRDKVSTVGQIMNDDSMVSLPNFNA